MGVREEDQRLVEIRNNGGHIYSISRLNTLNQCPYQAYLQYVRRMKGKDCVYGILGGRTHDCLEMCMNGKAMPDDIKTAINTELEDLDMIGLEFPKDHNGGDSIRNNWLKNMYRFAGEFKVPIGKFTTEELLILPLGGNNYLQGYSDLVRHNSNGTKWIIDWKTSSSFVGDHLIEAGRQLIVYKKALEHLGMKVSRCSWVMMKYYEAKWTLKNGNEKTKVGEWRNLGKDLKPQVEKWLKSDGMDDVDIDCITHEMLETNQIPDQVKDRIKVGIYVRDYEITPELEEECMEYIYSTISKFEEWGEDEDNWKPCDIKKESFFCATLCGQRDNCKYWKQYCDTFTKESDDDEENLF